VGYVLLEVMCVTKILLAPSILAADFARLGEQVRDAQTANADLIHIDVMDGRFVPNLTMGPLVVEAVKRSTTLPLDVHLMTIEPDQLLPAFVAAGASNLTVHVEACPHLHRTLQYIRSSGCRAGVALNPHTPASTIAEVLHMIDLIVVMSVNPGFGGQAFLPEVLPKVKQLRHMIATSGYNIDIEIDGGINTQTAVPCVNAGANVLIAGSAVFSPKMTVQAGMDSLRAAVATVNTI
jgi:ribulose-phosphate 3-epimerase